MNLKFDMAKIGGKVGVWLGLYVPLTMMLLLGFAAWIKVGIVPTGTLGSFSWDKLIPDTTTASSFVYFAPIMFILLVSKCPLCISLDWKIQLKRIFAEYLPR